MVKSYTLLSNKQRQELCRLIHQEGLTIKEAARRVNIPYPNAKAVNKTFQKEGRTVKKHYKFIEDEEEVQEIANVQRAPYRSKAAYKSSSSPSSEQEEHSFQVSLSQSVIGLQSMRPAIG
jgi:uncharacterized protein YpmB